MKIHHCDAIGKNWCKRNTEKMELLQIFSFVTLMNAEKTHTLSSSQRVVVER